MLLRTRKKVSILSVSLLFLVVFSSFSAMLIVAYPIADTVDSDVSEIISQNIEGNMNVSFSGDGVFNTLQFDQRSGWKNYIPNYDYGTIIIDAYPNLLAEEVTLASNTDIDTLNPISLFPATSPHYTDLLVDVDGGEYNFSYDGTKVVGIKAEARCRTNAKLPWDETELENIDALTDGDYGSVGARAWARGSPTSAGNTVTAYSRIWVGVEIPLRCVTQWDLQFLATKFWCLTNREITGQQIEMELKVPYGTGIAHILLYDYYYGGDWASLKTIEADDPEFFGVGTYEDTHGADDSYWDEFSNYNTGGITMEQFTEASQEVFGTEIFQGKPVITFFFFVKARRFSMNLGEKVIAEIDMTEFVAKNHIETDPTDPLNDPQDIYARINNGTDWENFTADPSEYNSCFFKGFENKQDTITEIQLKLNNSDIYDELKLSINYISIHYYDTITTTKSILALNGFSMSRSPNKWTFTVPNPETNSMFIPFLDYAYLDMSFSASSWDSGFEMYDHYVLRLEIQFVELTNTIQFNSSETTMVGTHLYAYNLSGWDRDINITWNDIELIGPMITYWDINGTIPLIYDSDFLGYTPYPKWNYQYSSPTNITEWNSGNSTVVIYTEVMLDDNAPIIDSFQTYEILIEGEFAIFSVVATDDFETAGAYAIFENIDTLERTKFELDKSGSTYSTQISFFVLRDGNFRVWYFVYDSAGNFCTSSDFQMLFTSNIFQILLYTINEWIAGIIAFILSLFSSIGLVFYLRKRAMKGNSCPCIGDPDCFCQLHTP